MNRSGTLLAVLAMLVSACDSANNPVAPAPTTTTNDLRPGETATGAAFTGSAIAINATLSEVSNKFCDSGPVAKAGGRFHTNVASASIAGVLSARDLECHAGGVNRLGYAEAGLQGLSLTLGGNTVLADKVHSMAGSECPPGAAYVTRGHTTITGLRVNGQRITVSGALKQRINLPNGYILINEQTSFVTSFHAGRTVIAIHVVINGSQSTGKARRVRNNRVTADVVIGRTQTHIDCP